MKKLLSGILIGMIIATAFGVFAATLGNAYFNSQVKLMVNGKAVTTDILSATIAGETNGKNYVSARDLAEALGATVTWDGATKTVKVASATDSKPTSTGYSYSNPAPMATMQTLTKKDLLQTYSVDTKITQVIRGAEAWTMVQNANMFNSPAPEGYEYLLTKIYLKVNDINDGEQYNLSDYNYTLVSSDGKDYEHSMEVAPEPLLSANLYKGASNEGWAIFTVKTTDLNPKIAFGRDYNGSGGLWFKVN